MKHNLKMICNINNISDITHCDTCGTTSIMYIGGFIRRFEDNDCFIFNEFIKAAEKGATLFKFCYVTEEDEDDDDDGIQCFKTIYDK